MGLEIINFQFQFSDSGYGQIVNGTEVLLKFLPNNDVARMTKVGSFSLVGHRDSFLDVEPLVSRMHISSKSGFEEIVTGLAKLKDLLIVQYYDTHYCEIRQRTIKAI